jgi:hypothetical protein
MPNPTSAYNATQGVVAAGAGTINLGFTPTAGRVLVLITAAAANQTVAGWTETRAVISDGELSFWTKTAAGAADATVSYTQNGPRALAWAALELPAGTTFTTGSQTLDAGDLWPSADTTGMPAGNKLVLWQCLRVANNPGTPDATWSGDATEWVQQYAPHDGNEGAALTVGFYEGTATTVAATMTTTGGLPGRHKVIMAAILGAGAPSNAAPTANAGVDQNVTVNSQVTLNGSASTDSDGSITSYAWTQTAGTAVTLNGTGATRTFIPTSAGSRTFQLTVTDNAGATAADTVVVNVTLGNAAPTANAGPDQSTTTGAEVTLTGAASTDADGTITNYAWAQTAGTAVALSGTGATRTFTPTSAGVRTFQLTVTDNTGSSSTDSVTITTTAPASNYGASVFLENQRQGDPQSQWWQGLSPLGLPSFGRSTYYAPGQTARFSVDCTTAFNITIHRLGHYGGNGARIVATGIAGTPATQPAPVVIPNSNGAVTCAAWSQNAEWAVPADALPGWYMATFRRTSDSQHGYALFLVSDANAKRKKLIVTGDATWHAAYNGFGGNNVYGDSTAIGNADARALCSTYDKPVITHANVPQTHFFNNTYPYLKWSERMGYDAAVASTEQIKNDPSILDGRDLIVFVGHNEYVPQNLVNKVKSLMAAGQNFVNAAGNDFFWRVKFTDGAFNSGTNGRVMWCKKDTLPGPSSGPNGAAHTAGVPFTTEEDWTGTWQDTRWSLREPSQDYWGDEFIANGVRADRLSVPSSYYSLPAWRNCSSLASGTHQFAPGTLGMEWDRPVLTNTKVEQVMLSETIVDLTNNASDVNGQNYNQTVAAAKHGMTLTRNAQSYTLNCNSDQWSWALDSLHLRGNAAPDLNAMQMMLNVIADLGVLPDSGAANAAGLTPPTPVSLTAYGFEATVAYGAYYSNGISWIPLF